MPSVCRWLFRHVLSSAGLSSSCSSSGVFPHGPSLGDLLLLCVQPCPVPGPPPGAPPSLQPRPGSPPWSRFGRAWDRHHLGKGRAPRTGPARLAWGQASMQRWPRAWGRLGFPPQGPARPGGRRRWRGALRDLVAAVHEESRGAVRGRAASSSRLPLFTPIASNAQSLTERVTSLRKAGFVLFALETARRFGENTVPVFTANVQTYCFPFETGSRETDLETPLSSGHSTSG